jgi:hypothetical protein
MPEETYNLIGYLPQIRTDDGKPEILILRDDITPGDFVYGIRKLAHRNNNAALRAMREKPSLVPMFIMAVGMGDDFFNANGGIGPAYDTTHPSNARRLFGKAEKRIKEFGVEGVEGFSSASLMPVIQPAPPPDLEASKRRLSKAIVSLRKTLEGSGMLSPDLLMKIKKAQGTLIPD